MSHRDTVFEPPPGFTRAGLLDRLAGRRVRGRRARHLRHPVPPRGRPHALRPGHPQALPRATSAAASATWSAGVDRRRADRAHPRPGRRRQGHLRPVGRRRLLGRGAARPPRDRRPADVRVRRPRPDAQERGRAGHRRLPRPLQGAARRRRRRGPLPRRSSRASPSPRPSARRSAPSSSASSRRRRRRLGDGERYLVQGTLYSDVIESGGGTGAATIKSHHNVGGLPDDLEFELVEPLRALFKDEVRAVGAELGLPERLVWRQPFPGPGLAIRIVGGEATKERLDTAARRRRDPPGRDPQGRPLPRAVAVLLRAARHPHGRRAGRRAHLRLRRRDPRRHLRRRDDRRLGAAALRPARADRLAHDQRDPRGQPGGARHHVASRPARSSGSSRSLG